MRWNAAAFIVQKLNWSENCILPQGKSNSCAAFRQNLPSGTSLITMKGGGYGFVGGDESLQDSDSTR
jgi:hypothetical protein